MINKKKQKHNLLQGKKKTQKYSYEFRRMPEEHNIYQELRTCTIEGNAAIK